MSPTQTFDVASTRLFNAPASRVWQAWADPNDVKQWWGPTGFSCPLANLDFRVGGKSLVCMRAPQEYGGQDSYSTWTYQSLEPNKQLEFIHNFSDASGNKLDPSAIGMPPGIPADVRHLITFKALGSQRTEMTVTEYGYTSQQTRDLSKAGLEQCLDKMARLIDTTP